MSSLWIGLADDGGGCAADYTVLRRFDQRREGIGAVAAAGKVSLLPRFFAFPVRPRSGANIAQSAAMLCYSRS
jgi:hypothetical protein